MIGVLPKITREILPCSSVSASGNSFPVIHWRHSHLPAECRRKFTRAVISHTPGNLRHTHLPLCLEEDRRLVHPILQKIISYARPKNRFKAVFQGRQRNIKTAGQFLLREILIHMQGKELLHRLDLFRHRIQFSENMFDRIGAMHHYSGRCRKSSCPA